MTPEEKVGVAVFLVATIGVFVAAASLFLRAAAGRLRGKPAELSPFERRVQKAVYALAAFGVLCVLYGWAIEPYRLAVTTVRVESLKVAGDPVRIVLFSDTHCDPKERLEGRLPAATAALRPDLIVFTGDSINEEAALPRFKALMTELAKVAPVYAVSGNWDAWFWPTLDLYGGTGARRLEGESLDVTVRGTKLQLLGLPADEGYQGKTLFARADKESLSIALHHYPDEVFQASDSGVDLYLAGHTHGGQVALPFYGALITLSRWGKRFEAGRYRVGPTTLYVNRGIGMEGGHAPRVRFWARPELTLIELARP
ncbi:MAG: hypothetical protein FD126_214 [Elusimicrobia bacterium]|nr:MAG: hypothetical protein FD126_214 [Elusimicrobiota bacterium]